MIRILTKKQAKYERERAKELVSLRYENRKLRELIEGGPIKDRVLRALEPKLDELRERKDVAYVERARCVALLASLAIDNGWRAGTLKTAIEGWHEEWHGCVYIDLPCGQVSWHYHDSHKVYFDHLPPYPGTWDGHDTDEKYRRVREQSLVNVFP